MLVFITFHPLWRAAVVVVLAVAAVVVAAAVVDVVKWQTIFENYYDIASRLLDV